MKAFVVPLWFGASSMFIVVALAFWKGGRHERLTAATMVWSTLLTLVLRDRSWPLVQWGGLLADVIFFIVILVIALRTTRWWPIFVTAFQLLNIAVYFAPLVVPGLNAWTLLSANIVFTQLCMITLACGCINNWRQDASARRQQPGSKPADRPGPRPHGSDLQRPRLPGRRRFAPGATFASNPAR